MKSSTRLLMAVTIGLTSLSVNALEKVEPVKALHNDKAEIKLNIEASLKQNLANIMVTFDDSKIALVDKKDESKLAKAKVKTSASTVAE